MFTRLPLYAKILLWFFLNLAVLVTVFLLFFNAEYHFNLNWVFGSNARHRVDAMRDLLVNELNTTAPDDWEEVIDRFCDAYQVRFALFDDEGHRLIGSVDKLPDEVRTKLLPRARAPALPAAPRPGVGGSSQQAAKSLIHTVNPARYWLLVGARVDNPQTGGTLFIHVVVEANTPSMGGLIIDPTPWLRLAVGAVVFSILFWLPLLRGMTGSIRQVTHATREIAAGRFDARVSTQRRDELGALAEAINQMAARLDGLMKDQKRFLGDVAHELCSPLARLQLALGIIEQRTGDGQRTYAKAAMEKAEQISRLVNELLDFSRASYGASAVRLEAVHVQDAVDEAVRREAHDGADIQVAIPAGLTVLADPELLVRALANLLRNAIRHGAQAGPITINATRGSEGVTIGVADSGPGVPEAELPKIFDAFYRVDAARTREAGGTGLGLAIVKACMDSCCGTVSARNRKPGGLEVRIMLAACDGPA